MRSVLKVLSWIADGIVNLFTKIPVKVGPINLRWTFCVVAAFAGFYFLFVRTDYAPTKVGFTSDVIIGLLLFGVVLDIFVHANAEQKQIESEDAAKLAQKS